MWQRWAAKMWCAYEAQSPIAIIVVLVHEVGALVDVRVVSVASERVAKLKVVDEARTVNVI